MPSESSGLRMRAAYTMLGAITVSTILSCGQLTNARSPFAPGLAASMRIATAEMQMMRPM